MTPLRRALPGWAWCVVAGLVLLAVLIAIFLSRGPRKPAVVVYGDSLTVLSESAAKHLQYDPGVRYVFRAKGGTALCDAIGEALNDKLRLHPVRVVIAFTGNTATCVRKTFDAGGAAAVVSLYEQGLRQMRVIYPTEPITIVIPPAMDDRVGWYPLNGDARLVAMYERVGPELHMTINTDADTWLTPGHVYAQFRPDLTSGKLVDVRLSDGIHLTPAGEQWYGAALLERHPGDFRRLSRTGKVSG